MRLEVDINVESNRTSDCGHLRLSVGNFCLAGALTLYPDQEGVIQSKLEEFWVSLHDRQKAALSRHLTFLIHVARVESSVLDRIFGERLLSLRSLAASACLSFTAMISFGSLVLDVVRANPDLILHALFLPPGLALPFTGYLFYRRPQPSHSGLPSRTWTVIKIGSVVIFFTFCVFVIFPMVLIPATNLIGYGQEDLFFMSVGVGLPCGFILDVLFIVTTRRLLRWISAMTSIVQVIAVLIGNTMLALCFLAPVVVMSYFGDTRTTAVFSGGANYIVLANLFDLSLALLFGIFVSTFLVHRIFWPLLNRTLFRFTDIGIKGRRALFFSVGLTLLGWAGLNVSEAAKKFLELWTKGG